MDELIFRHGLEEKLPEIMDANTVYYTTDTNRLFIGDTEYVKKDDIVVKNIYDVTEEDDGFVMGSNVKDYIEHSSQLQHVKEKGLYAVDEENNVSLQYTEEGFDVAKINPHFADLLLTMGIAADNPIYGQFTTTTNEGFFIIDENLNIGMRLDKDGVHAKNILEFEIID